MKKYILVALASILCAACNCQKNQSCGSSCCPTRETTLKIDSAMKTSNKSLSCKLTTPEIRERKQTVITALKLQVKEKKELSNGYSYRFDSSDSTIDLLTDFIKTERLCCDFFDFSLNVSSEGVVWLDITGPEGTKSFITSELEL